MAILVTGGAGYIGSHMVLGLLDAGREAVVIDNLSAGFRDATPASVPFVEGDVGDEDLVRSVLRDHKVDAVMHFAALTSVPESVRQPMDYYENNTGKTLRLLRACADQNVKTFVFSSTAAVYGDVHAARVSEDDPRSPLSPYGASKLMCERVLSDLAVAGSLSYGVLRYFNVAGADPQGRAGQRTRGATHLIKVACEVAAGRRPSMTVFGSDYGTRDGSCVRDYVHVSDLVTAHLQLLDYLRAGGESVALNCGYGRGYTVLEVIAAVEAEVGHKIDVTLGPRRPGDAVDVVADAGRIRDLLGWQPQHDDLRTIVRTTLAFEQGTA